MTIALVLEDDTFSAMALNTLLEDEGFTVRWFSDSDEAARYLDGECPDLLIADWQTEGALSSADLARRIRNQNSKSVIVFVTGYSADDLKGHLSDLDPFMIFTKPLDFDDFLSRVKASTASCS